MCNGLRVIKLISRVGMPPPPPPHPTPPHPTPNIECNIACSRVTFLFLDTYLLNPLNFVVGIIIFDIQYLEFIMLCTGEGQHTHPSYSHMHSCSPRARVDLPCTVYC